MAAKRTGSKRLLRELNQNIVLGLIAEQGPLSRTDLARLCGLPGATITQIVSDFVAAGLVTEVTSLESSGGRRPILLSIQAGAAYAVAVKLREDSMTLTVCDLTCAVIYHCEDSLPTGALPFEAVEVIAKAVERCIREAGVPRKRVLGVGVGLSGLIDSAHGLCRYSAILGWRNVELGPALEFRLRLPVHIDNDVNALAVAEQQFGSGRDVTDFLLVTIGRGVGLGVVVGGEIYRGAHGGAGEFGHITVDTSPDAPLCNCGRRGCLEAIASDYGIVRAVTGTDPGHAVEDVISALVDQARAGDTNVQTIFAHAGIVLGIAIANLINIFDPALVLLGGEGMRAGELILEPLRNTVPQHVFGRSNADIALNTLQTNEVNWARGAASLVLHEVFSPPIYQNEKRRLIDDLLAANGNRR